MTDYLEKALTAEEPEDETGAAWVETLSGEMPLFLTGKGRNRRESGGEASGETLPQSGASEGTARTEAAERSSGEYAGEMRMKAETESVAALSRRLSEAARMERALGPAAVQRKWDENGGSEEAFGSLSRGERSGDMLRSAEEFDRLVERDARRYGGTFSLF